MSQKKKVSRRHFLRTATGCTVGAVGLPYFVPSSAMGKAGYIAPSERITMGCIGLGGQGTRNMEQFIHQSDVQVVALCDVNKGSQDYLFGINHWGGLEPARKRALQLYEEQNKSLSPDSIGVYSDFPPVRNSGAVGIAESVNTELVNKLNHFRKLYEKEWQCSASKKLKNRFWCRSGSCF